MHISNIEQRILGLYNTVAHNVSYLYKLTKCDLIQYYKIAVLFILKISSMRSYK